jgi:tetratricopeptide (TPR) repeat protein
MFKTNLAAGKASLAGKDYPGAIKSLSSAVALMPQDKEASDLLRRAQTEDQQRQTGYQFALNAGQKSLQSKNYDAAVKSFQQALQWIPNDAKATQLLQEAQQGQNGAKLQQGKYAAAMKTGQFALAAKKYTEAIKAYTEALSLMPGDPMAQQGLLQAQQGAQTEAAVASYQKAIAAGKNALNARQYDAAIKAFNDALKVAPNDPQAKQMLQQAQEARAQVAQYLESMKAGNAALQGKKYADAVKAYEGALQLFPTDPNAAKMLKQAQQLWNSSKKTQPPPMKETDTPKIFDQAMKSGAALEKEQKYAEAVKAFQEALKLRPKDANAYQGALRNQYYLHLTQGQQYLDMGMFIEAQREFESALGLFPKDPTALKLLAKAKKKMR